MESSSSSSISLLAALRHDLQAQQEAVRGAESSNALWPLQDPVPAQERITPAAAAWLGCRPAPQQRPRETRGMQPSPDRNNERVRRCLDEALELVQAIGGDDQQEGELLENRTHCILTVEAVIQGTDGHEAWHTTPKK